MDAYGKVLLGTRPVAAYQMGEKSGNLRDLVGVWGNATMTGTPGFGAGALPIGGGTSINFSGSTSEGAVVAYSSVMDMQTFTLAAWVLTTASSAAASLMVRDDNSVKRTWWMRLASGKLNFIVFSNGGGTNTSLTSVKSVNDGRLHFVVCTRTPTVMAVWIDASLDNAVGNTYTLAGAQQMGIGIRDRNVGFGDPYNGKLNWCSIWNREMHVGEMKRLYQVGRGQLIKPFGMVA